MPASQPPALGSPAELFLGDQGGEMRLLIDRYIGARRREEEINQINK